MACSLSESEEKTVQDVFAALMPTGASVELRPLTPNDAPVQITKPEFMRRMKEMQMMSGMGMGDFGDFYNVVVNTNHPLISDKFLKADAEKQQDLANYLYGLARINQNMLKGADLTAFVQKS